MQVWNLKWENVVWKLSYLQDHVVQTAVLTGILFQVLLREYLREIKSFSYKSLK